MSITLRAKRILTGALAGALVLGLLPAGVASAASDGGVCAGAASAGFPDAASATHQANIDCIAAYGVITGRADGTFGGSASITRGQFATLIAKFAQVASGAALPVVANTFADVTGNVHADNIARIVGANIASGRSATAFAPNDTITRAEAATMLKQAHDALGVTFAAVTPATNFTDVSGTHAANMNLLAGAGVVSGKSATTFGSSQAISRAEIATLLVRSANLVLVVQNKWSAVSLVASAAVTVVSVASSNVFSYADPATKAAKTATVKDTDSFTVGGVASSKAVFLAAVSIADQVVIGANSYALTNVTRDNILSGVVGAIDDVDVPTDFNIISPITGTALRTTEIEITGSFTFYTVGGVTVTEAVFKSALNNGDTVVISGNATGVNGTLAAPRTIALTNQKVSGTVSIGTLDAGNVGLTAVSIKSNAGAVLVMPVVAIADDTITVDGAAAAVTAASLGSVTVNDLISYSRTAGKSTVAITNVAFPAVTGVVAGAIPASGAADLQFYVGAATTVTDSVANVAGYTLRVGGIVVTGAEFLAALTPGDTVVVQEADGKIVTTGTLSVTNQALTGYVNDITLPATVDVSAVLKADFSYAQELDAALDTADADSLFTGNTTIVRTVNGAAATEAVYNAELVQIRQGYKTGVITISDAGTVTNISLTTTATGAATLINAVRNSATQITLTFDKAVHVTNANAFVYGDVTTSSGAIVSVAPSTTATASTTVVVTGTAFTTNDTISIDTRTSIRSAGNVPAASNGAVFLLN